MTSAVKTNISSEIVTEALSLTYPHQTSRMRSDNGTFQIRPEHNMMLLYLGTASRSEDGVDALLSWTNPRNPEVPIIKPRQIPKAGTMGQILSAFLVLSQLLLVAL